MRQLLIAIVLLLCVRSLSEAAGTQAYSGMQVVGLDGNLYYVTSISMMGATWTWNSSDIGFDGPNDETAIVDNNSTDYVAMEMDKTDDLGVAIDTGALSFSGSGGGSYSWSVTGANGVLTWAGVSGSGVAVSGLPKVSGSTSSSNGLVVVGLQDSTGRDYLADIRQLLGWQIGITLVLVTAWAFKAKV